MFPRNIVRLGITIITSHSDDYVILISCVSGKIDPLYHSSLYNSPWTQVVIS